MGARQGSKMEKVLKKDPTDTILNIRAAHDQTVKFEEDDASEDDAEHNNRGQ